MDVPITNDADLHLFPRCQCFWWLPWPSLPPWSSWGSSSLSSSLSSSFSSDCQYTFKVNIIAQVWKKMKWFNCFGVNGDFQRNVFPDLYQKTPLKHVPISLSLYEGKTEKFFFTNIVVSSAYLFARHVFFYFFEKGCLLLESVSNYVSPGSGFVPKIMYGWSYISTYRPFSILYLSPDLISPAHSLVCFVFTSQLPRWRVTETLISFLSGNSDTSCSGLTGLWLVSLWPHWPLIGGRDPVPVGRADFICASSSAPTRDSDLVVLTNEK